jgi:hypothetical protein
MKSSAQEQPASKWLRRSISFNHSAELQLDPELVSNAEFLEREIIAVETGNSLLVSDSGTSMKSRRSSPA